MLLEIIAIVLVSVVFGTLLQEKIGLPSIIFYIIIGLLFGHFYPDILKFEPKDFKYLILITLPFLIASDTFGITWKSIKKNYISILLLAVVNVVVTVIAIVAFGNFILPGISVLMLILLASAISPTDPVGVNAALSNFKVPHKLSFKLESESLSNDIVALSIFSITIGILTGEITNNISSISLETLKLIIESIGVGIVIGYIGLKFLEFTKDVYIETFIVLTAIFTSFLITDHFLHVSGIFAVIVVMIFINEEIKDLWEKNKIKGDDVLNPKNHKFLGRILHFLGIISNAFLFIALGSLVDFFNFDSFVWQYFEISFYIFLFITIVRGIFMFVYAKISKSTKKIQNINNLRWWSVLTFGGMRGGLSILMIFILAGKLPNNEYIQELEAIVFNVVFLITFIYTPILIFVFKKYKKLFQKEYEYEIKHNL